jgi:integral membrane sensor domain MASE1
MGGFKRVLIRAGLFSAASNAAVLFVLLFGSALWRDGLPANSQNVFWLASGVNLAALLVLGLRYWPIILLNAVPAWLIAGQPLEITLLASATNAMEAVLAAAIIGKAGAFDGRLDRGRTVAALLGASVVAPMANTLIIPAWFCLRDAMPWGDYWTALGNWNLSNGAAMLLVAPFLLSLRRGGWTFASRKKEALGLAALSVVFSLTAFHAVFLGAGMNFAFIVFPPVIYAAVRFGVNEMSAVFLLVLASIYVSLTMHHHAPPLQMSSAIWFVQAFAWVLASTGLVVSALVFARRDAEEATANERARLLEVSLREERSRLEALRYQLNPHFLFNSLNSIYSTLPVTEAEVPRNMISQLSGYLRSTLSTREKEFTPLRDELRSVKQYLAIEEIRFGDDLRVSVEADERALAEGIPPFLLQPLVENAIVHGFAATRGVFYIAIRARIDDTHLHIEVCNTGTWKEPVSEGVGMGNTRRRLALIFGARASLNVAEEEGWVKVRLELPVKREGDIPCDA